MKNHHIHEHHITGPNDENWLAVYEYLPGRPLKVDRDRREDPAEPPQVRICWILDENSISVKLDSLPEGVLEGYEQQILEKWEGKP